MILSPHVAGIGLTILGANHVIHYGRWWNPAKEAQATDRAYRIGQDKEVFVYYPIYKSNCFETFDEKLDRLIEGKRALARDFLTPIEDLEISAKDMLFDLSYDITTPQKTNSTLMNIKNISETEFKTLIYLLMQKEGKQIDYLSEKNSFGVDLIVNNKNGKELYKTFTIEIDELDIDNFILTINKLNKNGCNNIFISTNLAPKVIKYAKENDINIYTQKEIENLIKKHKINQNALLSIIIDKKEIDNI